MRDWLSGAFPAWIHSLYQTLPMLSRRRLFACLILPALAAGVPFSCPAETEKDPSPPPPAPLGPAEPLSINNRHPNLPTLWIAGDSTAAKGGANATGWGVPLASMVDPAQLNLVNGARGGRSSRTFITEGLWEKMITEVKTGDWVVIQFGHNDAGPINDNTRARGSLRSTGDESEDIVNQLTQKPEKVRTYGWYLRKMISETKAKGATPVLFSITVRNEWADGKVERRNGPWSELARQTAQSTGTTLVDLTNLIADAYDRMGPEQVKPFFPKDHTHTGPEGAAFSASLVAKALQDVGVPGMMRKEKDS